MRNIRAYAPLANQDATSLLSTEIDRISAGVD